MAGNPSARYACSGQAAVGENNTFARQLWRPADVFISNKDISMMLTDFRKRLRRSATKELEVESQRILLHQHLLESSDVYV